MRKIIVIDDGHSEDGQPDPGAIGNNLRECDLTGEIGNAVQRQLSGHEAEVLLAPRGTLSERAAFANQVGASLLVSIHINAGGGTGYETHIYTHPSEQAAKIGEAIHKVMAAYYVDAGFKDRGLKRSNFAVLRETKMPAVLLENLFIDSLVDANFLALNLHAIGNEIAYALVVALGISPKPSEVAKQDCETCPKLNKLFAENQRMKNALANISISTAEYVIK